MIMQSTLPGIFLWIFSFPCLPEETCFQQEGSFVVEGTNQVVLGSSDHCPIHSGFLQKKLQNPMWSCLFSKESTNFAFYLHRTPSSYSKKSQWRLY
jgi:hypothetical protein